MIDEGVELNEGYSNPLWRGHGNCDWDLKPEIFRHDTYLESDMLWDFVTRGSSRIHNPPAITDEIAWLHLAQHYGLPTRLLDWSFNPLAAMYFAVGDIRDDGSDGCIWALNAGSLNLSTLRVDGIMIPASEETQLLISEAFNPSRRSKTLPPVVAFSALENDVRMLVQQSAFTIHRDSRDLRSLRRGDPLLRQFVIPKSHKAQVRRWLSLVGIERATLFPDLPGLANSIKSDFS